MAKISDIKNQKKGDRVNIYIDGRFFCGMQTEIVIKNKLKTGSEIDVVQLEKLQYESEKNKIFSKALSLIDMKPYFESEIREKLKRRGYLPAIVDETIEKLKEYNFVDDFELAKLFVESQKNRSWREILYKLKRKGVSDLIISKLESCDENASCLAVCEKYMRHKEKSVENKQKTMRYLVSKGFDFEISKRCIESIYGEGEVCCD